MHQDGPSSAPSMLPAGGLLASTPSASSSGTGARARAHCPSCPRPGRKPGPGVPAIPKSGTARKPKAEQKAVHPSGSNAPSAAGHGDAPLAKKRKARKPSRNQGGQGGSQPPHLSGSRRASSSLTARTTGVAVTNANPSQHLVQLAPVNLDSGDGDGGRGGDLLGCSGDHRKSRTAAAYWHRKEAEERGRWECLHNQNAEMIQELGCFRNTIEHQLQVLRETCIEILAELRIRPEATSPCPYPSADPVSTVTEEPPVRGGLAPMDLEPVQPDSTTGGEPSATSISI